MLAIEHRNPLTYLLLSQSLAGAAAAKPPPVRYPVDLNDRADSVFKITLRVDSLPAASGVFQFASTAPGTYQVMDIGRYVRRRASHWAMPDGMFAVPSS